MLEKVKEYINNAYYKEPIHFERSLYWLMRLKPDADEAMQIATYAHDIDRVFDHTKEVDFYKDKEFNDSDYLEKHQQAGAEIIGDFLFKNGYDKGEARRVAEMVGRHEDGGDLESDLIKDVDSISFFEVNAKGFIDKFIEVLGKEKIERKFNYMFNRISSKKAKKIARPLYERALELLEK